MATGGPFEAKALDGTAVDNVRIVTRNCCNSVKTAPKPHQFVRVVLAAFLVIRAIPVQWRPLLAPLFTTRASGRFCREDNSNGYNCSILIGHQDTT